MMAVDAMLARSYPKLLKADYPPSVLVTAIPLISHAQPRLLTCGTYYVAEQDGEIRGAGGWTRDRTNRARGHIRHVVTDYRHLRHGIARAILFHTFEMARRSGVTRMECWSTRTAEPFYESLGFAVLGPMELELAPGILFPFMRMIREL